ncbi:MAG: hypothetical protein LR015_12155 [Verrucomicrobia bacterium]|nr:hypothetical protein [Verrucomicrobiota bacterium]
MGVGTEGGGNPGLGGNFGDIYIAAGELIEFTPTQRRNPLNWVAIDTFDNGSPNNEWFGDLESVALDFSENRLKISGATTAPLPSIRVPLPQSVQTGQFTLTFDLMIPSENAFLNLGAISQAESVSTTAATRLGGGDRLVTFGSPQRLTVQSIQSDTSVDLLSPTTLGEWYHVWMVYDFSDNSVSVYRLPFGTLGGSTPTLTRKHTLSGSRSSFDFLALGIGRGLGSSATNTGFEIDNIYFASGELLEFSPTAGELGGGTGPTDPSVLPAIWVDAFADRNADGWFWISFNSADPQSGTGAWAWSNAEILNWVFVNGLGWVYVYGNEEPDLFLFVVESNSWYYTSMETSDYKAFFNYNLGAWSRFLTPDGQFGMFPL